MRRENGEAHENQGLNCALGCPYRVGDCCTADSCDGMIRGSSTGTCVWSIDAPSHSVGPAGIRWGGGTRGTHHQRSPHSRPRLHLHLLLLLLPHRHQHQQLCLQNHPEPARTQRREGREFPHTHPRPPVAFGGTRCRLLRLPRHSPLPLVQIPPHAWFSAAFETTRGMHARQVRVCLGGGGGGRGEGGAGKMLRRVAAVLTGTGHGNSLSAVASPAAPRLPVTRRPMPNGRCFYASGAGWGRR